MSDVLDLVVIGAGPAGIAAARLALRRGLTVRIIEARSRIGGRVETRHFAGHPVDLGAHWLHAGPINPVVKLARSEHYRLKRAPQERHLFLDGRRLQASLVASYDAAFARADKAFGAALPDNVDAPAADRLPFLGPWRRPVAAITGLVCGRPLAEVSTRDFASAEYADNLFAPDGFGALIARLGRGLPITLGARVTEVDWSRHQIRIQSSAGAIEARRLIVTVPPLVLQRGGIRFTPSLPERTGAAIHGFRAAIYEHVLLRWPGAPFRGADRIATLTGRRTDGVGLLTRLDGTCLHYLEFDAPMSQSCRQPRTLSAAYLARDMLKRQFGARALQDLQVLHVTDWLSDPFSRSSWSCVPPGHAHIRDDLAEPIDGKLAFAGEMTDHAQWGTVGGAWGAGERAVGALFGPG